jgi:cytochrome c oxidase cbb3-type subunit 3
MASETGAERPGGVAGKEARAKHKIKEVQDRIAFGDEPAAARLEWDGIRKLDYPPPRWWVLTFWATIAFAVLWWLLYPSWPGLRGYFPGLLGYQQRVEVGAQLAVAEAARARFVQAIGARPLEEIRTDPQLQATAMAAGRVAFNNHCAQCHGLGGAGQGFFPSLADDDWLWGGSPEEIERTITHGVRNGGDEARDSPMPRFGVDEMLTPEQIDEVAGYVLSLSSPPAAGGEAAVQRGAAVFVEQCAACHGEDGGGIPEMGAPRLNDALWLYGGEKAQVVAQIIEPRHGVMPAFAPRLDPATIRMLVIYVHSLGGGR